MKKTLFAMGCMLAASTSHVAFADGEASGEKASPLSVTLTVTSDYRFRGQSQNGRSPAAQGSIEYASDIGVTFGAWASNVDFSDTGDNDTFMEADFYASYGFSLDDATTGAAKVTFYHYPDSPPGVAYDYWEGQLSLSHTMDKLTVNLEANYSPDYFNETGAAMAIAAGVEYPVFEKISASANVGHQWIDDNVLFGTDDYLYWDVGFGIDLGRLQLDARYVSTNIDEADCFGGTNLCEGGFVASASISFP